MIESVIFDMDGLLIDSEAATFRLYEKIGSTYGKTIDMAFYHKLLGRNALHIHATVAEHFGDSALATQVIKEVHDGLEKSFREEGVPLKNGALALVEYLKSEGVKIGVATSSSRYRAIDILERGQLLHMFDVVVCGDEVDRGKPHPDIFLKVQKALGSEPEKTVVIEDSESGIIGAHIGGMQCIHVPDLKKSSELILEKADFIARDLVEVMGYIRRINASAEKVS